MSYFDNRKVISDKAKKVVEEGQEASRGKRRRILQFTSDADGTTADNEQLSAPLTISKVINSTILTTLVLGNLF